MRSIACAAALLAACAHPAPPAHPADLAHLGLPTELRFEGKSEQYGDDPLSWDFTRNDDELFSRFSVIPWKPAWPDDFAAFGARLAEVGFIDQGFHFAITKQSRAPGEWLYLGTEIDDKGAASPNFVMVRTVGGARFFCHLDQQVDEQKGLDAAIAGCRAITLSTL